MENKNMNEIELENVTGGAYYGNNYYTGRSYTDTYDLSNFAMVMTRLPLEHGKTYSYKLTANLATMDDIVIHESEFTYG